MKVRKYRMVLIVDDTHQFINEKFREITKRNYLINQGVIGWRSNTVIFPQEVLHHVEGLTLHNVRIQQYHARFSGDQPYPVLNVVAFFTKRQCGLTKDIL